MALEVNGKSYEVDEEGYLANLNDWDEGIFLSDSLNSSDKNEISWKSHPISINSAGKQFARLKISTR